MIFVLSSSFLAQTRFTRQPESSSTSWQTCFSTIVTFSQGKQFFGRFKNLNFKNFIVENQRRHGEGIVEI